MLGQEQFFRHFSRFWVFFRPHGQIGPAAGRILPLVDLARLWYGGDQKDDWDRQSRRYMTSLVHGFHIV